MLLEDQIGEIACAIARETGRKLSSVTISPDEWDAMVERTSALHKHGVFNLATAAGLVAVVRGLSDFDDYLILRVK